MSTCDAVFEEKFGWQAISAMARGQDVRAAILSRNTATSFFQSAATTMTNGSRRVTAIETI